jgi:nucleoside-diphosphate-sugar epimerase
MRIFVAGASGAIGRALLPELKGHTVVGMTRSRPELVRELGAQPVVCDVYDRKRLSAVLAGTQRHIVVDLLTDLAHWDFAANNRIRREGTRNLVDAAVAAGTPGLLVESVAFDLPAAGAAAVAEMERIALESGLRVHILRFGRLWGPNTAHPENLGEPGRMHVSDAAQAIVAALRDFDTF